MVLTHAGHHAAQHHADLAATRWGHRNRERRGVRAFKQGMAPVVIALLVATAWLLARRPQQPRHRLALWLLTSGVRTAGVAHAPAPAVAAGGRGAAGGAGAGVISPGGRI
jgi:chromate transport protein ChrA